MEIQVKESTIVRPAQKTPKYCQRNSDLDLLVPVALNPIVYFYRRTNDNSFNCFEIGLLKESLSKILVPFYPVAGRVGRDENGRLEIQCNGEGVLFIEAETNCVIDDLGDFSSSSKLMHLVPVVDQAKDIFSYPLLMTQITHFKCGGICLGVRLHHIIADATSIYHFINSWAEVTRGSPISIPPVYDRTILGVGVPPSPTFNHLEYYPPPSMNKPAQNIKFQSNPESSSTAILELSLDQINTLKERSQNDHGYGSTVKYSKFEILAAHVWRCACKARGLSYDQASKIYVPTNGRSKLNPQLPPGYFGNAVFITASVALSGDMLSEPLNYTTERIHKVVRQMDDKYLKSSLAYLGQQPDLTVLKRGPNTYKCPNLMITKLANMPMYDANFGWGRPIFVTPISSFFEGMVIILPGPINDGSWLLAVNLQTNHLQLFKKFFYEIFSECQNVRSRY